MLQEQQQQQHEQEQQQQHIRSSPDLRRMKGQTPKRKNYYFAHTQIHSLMRSSVKKRNITKNNLQTKRTRNNTQKIIQQQQQESLDTANVTSLFFTLYVHFIYFMWRSDLRHRRRSTLLIGYLAFDFHHIVNTLAF